MIRKLMASSAVLALLSAGAFNVAQANDTTSNPAAVQAGAASTNAADTAAASDKLTPSEPTLATAFMGRPVYASADPNANSIGDVNDLIIGKDGSITDAVVGVGGFLGIGEKNVAVPFDKLKVEDNNGDIRLIYAATKEELQNAPAFDRTAYDPAARAAQQNAAAAANAPVTTPLAPALTGAPAPQTATNSANTVPPAKNQAAPQTDQNMAANTPAATNSSAAFLSASADQIRASVLMGQDVYGPDKKSIGKISDLILQQDGGTRVALIDVGGFLGVGAKTVAIPFDELKVSQPTDNSERQVTVAMTKDQIQQLPTYTPPEDKAAANMTPPAANVAPPAANMTTGNNMAASQTARPRQVPARPPTSRPRPTRWRHRARTPFR